MRGKIIDIPFSSSRFLFNEENFGAAYHEIHQPMVARQKNINQLQRLTHPPIKNCAQAESGYLWFPFPQSRFDHAIRIVPVAKIILEKLGYDKAFIDQFILTALTHDIATPTGGDATMRMNKTALCEVRNYARFMLETGLAQKWQQTYGFCVHKAASLIGHECEEDFLLGFLDKWSYTALDIFHLGKRRPEAIANLLKKDKLVMDIWQSIAVEKDCLHFTNAKRLYDFLLLRALMHSEFYLNPACRKLEHVFFCEMKRLFEAGKISLDDLRFKDDHWLNSIVRENKEPGWCSHPQEISYAQFESEHEADCFYAEKDGAFHKEQLKPFKTGMHWLVSHKGEIMPLHNTLSKKQTDRIEKIANSKQGWFVYYYN